MKSSRPIFIAILFTVLCLSILVYCTNRDTELPTKSGRHFGVTISNTVRHGRPNSFFNISTTIINDTTTPVHLKISFLKEYSHNDEKFKIVLLPESMTTETLNNDDFFRTNVRPFLSSTYLNSLDKIIQPKENYIVNIAFVKDNASNFIPGQLAIVSKLHPFAFTSIADTMIKMKRPSSDSLALSLGLNFCLLSDSCYGFKLIPCGTIYYSK